MSKDSIKLLLILASILFAFIVCYYVIPAIKEKKAFNNGICKRCGEKLSLIDANVSNVYFCKDCEIALYIHSGIDKKFLQHELQEKLKKLNI